MQGREVGFTMLELLTVILILGLLGAIAAPRFLNVTGGAKRASFDAVKAAFAESVFSAHVIWAAGGGAGAAVTLEGTPIEVNAAGWPRVDNTATNQMTALDLYNLVMNTTLPSDWAATEDLGASTADYTYEEMTFCYAASDGRVTVQ